MLCEPLPLRRPFETQKSQGFFRTLSVSVVPKLVILTPNTRDLSGSVQRRGGLVDAEFDNRAGGSMGGSRGRSPYILQVFMITGNGEALPGL